MQEGRHWSMSRQARLFLILVCLLGLIVAIDGARTSKWDDGPNFVVYLLTAIIASRLKVGGPEVTGTMSVNFLFIVIGIAELNFSETLILGCAAILAQCFGHRRWPKLEQVLFNVASAAVAIWLAHFTYHRPLEPLFHTGLSLLLVVSAWREFSAHT